LERFWPFGTHLVASRKSLELPRHGTCLSLMLSIQTALTHPRPITWNMRTSVKVFLFFIFYLTMFAFMGHPVVPIIYRLDVRPELEVFFLQRSQYRSSLRCLIFANLTLLVRPTFSHATCARLLASLLALMHSFQDCLLHVVHSLFASPTQLL
jgi:hypothetical protein